MLNAVGKLLDKETRREPILTDQTALHALLKQMADGNQQAFSQFYDATVSRTFGFIMRITVNKQLAEEVASDVYMQVWRTAVNYNAELAAPMTWLMMMARSRAIDALRRESSATKNQLPLIEAFDRADETEPGPLMETLEAEEMTTLNELLKVLTATERQMIVLAFFKGMSHSEIAVHTGKPLGTVKTIMRRAQAVLRSTWRKAYFTVQSPVMLNESAIGGILPKGL